MDNDLIERLVPPRLWDLVEPKLPEWESRKQGGGTTPRDSRSSLAAVVFVVVTGCAWHHLPPVFGVSKATAHRRFTTWTSAGLWTAFGEITPSDVGGDQELAWLRKFLHAAQGRAARARRAARSPATVHTSSARLTSRDDEPGEMADRVIESR